MYDLRTNIQVIKFHILSVYATASIFVLKEDRIKAGMPLWLNILGFIYSVKGIFWLYKIVYNLLNYDKKHVISKNFITYEQ